MNTITVHNIHFKSQNNSELYQSEQFTVGDVLHEQSSSRKYPLLTNTMHWLAMYLCQMGSLVFIYLFGCPRGGGPHLTCHHR